MAKSEIRFERWNHIQTHSWPFQVYKLYNEELSGFFWSIEAASKFTYKNLAINGAKWDDVPSKHFPLPDYRIATMKTLKGWSDVYIESQNWLGLNYVMAISSNLETFLSSVVALSIESNPGVLLGASKEIDGVKMLKYNSLDPSVYEKKVLACVKGSWSNRLSAFEELFGSAPNSYRSGIGSLERMRRLRNNLGHAFGRDIDASRDFSINMKQPADRIQLKTVIKYLELGFNIASDIDSFLLDNHIGEFQAILAYHKHYDEYSKYSNDGERAIALKKLYGKLDHPIGKRFCRELVAYYNSL